MLWTTFVHLSYILNLVIIYVFAMTLRLRRWTLEWSECHSGISHDWNLFSWTFKNLISISRYDLLHLKKEMCYVFKSAYAASISIISEQPSYVFSYSVRIYRDIHAKLSNKATTCSVTRTRIKPSQKASREVALLSKKSKCDETKDIWEIGKCIEQCVKIMYFQVLTETSYEITRYLRTCYFYILAFVTFVVYIKSGNVKSSEIPLILYNVKHSIEKKTTTKMKVWSWSIRNTRVSKVIVRAALYQINFF